MSATAGKSGARKSVSSLRSYEFACDPQCRGDTYAGSDASILDCTAVFSLPEAPKQGEVGECEPGRLVVTDSKSGEVKLDVALPYKGFNYGIDDDEGVERLTIVPSLQRLGEQRELEMKWDDLQKLDALLLPLCKIRFESYSDEDDIGTYGQHVECAGTDLLLAGDAAAATHTDVENIYRALRSLPARDGQVDSRSLAAGGSFLSLPDVCLVTEPARKQLMNRLDEQHARTGDLDTKLVITLAELEAAVGTEGLATLQQRFGAPIDCVKLRRVSAGGQGSSPDVINFHLDVAAKTMGIPLNDAEDYEGSRLTYAVASTGSLVQPNRRAGSCTIHDNGIAHGVTPLLKGVRYGLFLLSSQKA